MLLPESLLWAIGDDGCSAVKIFCEEDQREKVATRFTELFNEEYEAVMELIVQEDGDSYEKEKDYNPFTGAQITEYGVFLPFEQLAMFCEDGDYLASYDACQALDKALERLKTEFPFISYEGYVGYCWSDMRGGDVNQYEVSSEELDDTSDVIYDFVGKKLGEVLEEEYSWDALEGELEEEEDFLDVLETFKMYHEFIPSDAIEKLIEIAGDVDEDIQAALEEAISE